MSPTSYQLLHPAIIDTLFQSPTSYSAEGGLHPAIIDTLFQSPTSYSADLSAIFLAEGGLHPAIIDTLFQSPTSYSADLSAIFLAEGGLPARTTDLISHLVRSGGHPAIIELYKYTNIPFPSQAITRILWFRSIQAIFPLIII